MTYGFVYCLNNPAMPGVFKIGRTYRSPMARAMELSASTSAPMKFQVLCYGEFKDPAAAELDMHQRLDSYRINQKREFFRAPFEWIYTSLLEDAEAFCVTSAGRAELECVLNRTPVLKAVK